MQEIWPAIHLSTTWAKRDVGANSKNIILVKLHRSPWAENSKREKGKMGSHVGGNRSALCAFVNVIKSPLNEWSDCDSGSSMTDPKSRADKGWATFLELKQLASDLISGLWSLHFKLSERSPLCPHCWYVDVGLVLSALCTARVLTVKELTASVPLAVSHLDLNPSFWGCLLRCSSFSRLG